MEMNHGVVMLALFRPLYDYYDNANQSNGGLGAAYLCPDCGRSYRWRDNLRRHQRMECGKEASFWCSLCPFRSKHKHSLLRHLHNRHFTAAAAAEAAADLAIASAERPSNNSNNQNLDESVTLRGNDIEYSNSF